ncbi:MAG: hypothetical protein COZ25_04995 [Ignavibacteria bacterium CG_4_10_14_3_um_filter_37_18]|nr:MAG: hypothetical protein COZ25_04995 [Ignavibacteria bacterium CG_4_10_14_3_um_filter_37_18]
MPENALHLLIGPNASGKSQELNLLVEKSIDKLSFLPKHLFTKSSTFGFLRQSTQNPQMSQRVFSNLAIPLLLSGQDEKKVKQEIINLLTYFNFDYLLNQNVKNLSGGELKIVSLLSELLLDRRFFIMDDPFGSLDSIRKNIVTEIIQKVLSDSFNNVTNLRNLIISLTDAGKTEFNLLTDTTTNHTEINLLENKFQENTYTEFYERHLICRSRPNIGNLSITNLTLKIKDQNRVLFDCANFLFQSGKINLFSCPNGSGKTLLLNIIMGYCPKEITIQSGNIYVEALDKSFDIPSRWIVQGLSKYSKNNKKLKSFRNNKIIYVPQHCDYLLANYSPRDFCKEIFQTFYDKNNLGVIPEEIINVLFDERKIIEHSVGEIRFYTILFAIMITIFNREINLLILDEPDSLLDNSLQHFLIKLLHRVLECGVNIIITSHNQKLFNNLEKFNVITF